jgi:hypothetical protein
MSLIRGVLLAGKFRTHHQLNGMSNDDQRNTLIVEMAGRTNQSGAHFQSMDDVTLAGAGAVLIFLRTGRIRTDAELKTISDDDQRNILIVELAGQTKLSGPVLQGMSNLDLVLLGLGKGSSFIRGVLLAGEFRTQHELNVMSHDDQRNTLIVEMAGRTNQSGAHFQSLDDVTLAGAGAVLVFLREAGIRTDAQLKTMSDDGQRNTLIVEIDGQTHLGSQLQGLKNMDLVLAGLGMDINFGPVLRAHSNSFQIRPELAIDVTKGTPKGSFHMTISHMPGKSGDIHRDHSFDGHGVFNLLESFEVATVSREADVPNIEIILRDDTTGKSASAHVAPNPFFVRFG